MQSTSWGSFVREERGLMSQFHLLMCLFGLLPLHAVQPKSGILRLDAAGPFFLHDVIHDQRQRRPGAHVALRQAVRNNLQLSVPLEHQ